jgi:hypothetical protein
MHQVKLYPAAKVDELVSKLKSFISGDILMAELKTALEPWEEK